MNKVGVFLVVGLSIVPSHMGAEGGSDAILDLFNAPKTAISGCASSVARLLKGNPKHTVTLVENKHNPWITDYRHTMQSGAVAVVFLEATESGRCLLEQVDVIGPQEVVPLPVDIVAPRREVIQTLGPPSSEYTGVDIYDIDTEIGSDRVIIRYENGVVNSISWKYFVD
jgi:hypothetical protein